MAEKNATQDPMKQALDELDELEKSFDDGTELDELLKALDEEVEDLEKSSGDDGGDDGDGEGGDDEGDGGDPIDKSEDEDFTEELIKASQAYADLEKSVTEGIESVNSEVSCLQKSVESLLALSVKQAKVIGSLVKSVQEIGAQPVGASKTQLGVGSQQDDGKEMTKSVSEISDLLLKAVQEDKVDARYLSIFGTYKTPDVLPAEVKEAIGL